MFVLLAALNRVKQRCDYSADQHFLKCVCILQDRIDAVCLRILKRTFVYTINASYLDVTNDVTFICMYSNWRSNKMWCTEIIQLIRGPTVFF